jgi:hypothetical protein
LYHAQNHRCKNKKIPSPHSPAPPRITPERDYEDKYISNSDSCFTYADSNPQLCGIRPGSAHHKQALENYKKARERQKYFSSLVESANTIFIGKYTGECKHSSNSSVDWDDFFFAPEQTLKGDVGATVNVRIWNVPKCESYLNKGKKYLVIATFVEPKNYQPINGAYDPSSWFFANPALVIPLDK